MFPKVVCALMLMALPSLCADQPRPLHLRDAWNLQSVAIVREGGEEISTTAYHPKGWYRTSVPTTVFAALVDNKVYPDPYFGMNLLSVPGTEYARHTGANDIQHNFSNAPMPPDSPFKSAWWFRTEFRIPEEYRSRTAWLHFDGINYRANVWLNGQRIAAADDTAGAWRVFQFDVTGSTLPGQQNVLAVQVFPPQSDDLAISWVDWNPAPPDKNTGLWRDVYLEATGPVEIRWPHVISRLDLPSFRSVGLTVKAELHNADAHPVKGVLHGSIGAIRFSQPVELAPKEARAISFSYEKFPQLKIRNPLLWWPAKLGPQNLYELGLRFETSGQISSAKTVHFGVREVTSELNEKGSRVFKINGKRILVRGAGWAPDMLLRVSPGRQEAEIDYVLDMNLNAIRLEGKIEDEHFLDLCDRKGVLLMAGWCCCDHWEKWADWKSEDYRVSEESLRDQIRRFRSRPDGWNVKSY